MFSNSTRIVRPVTSLARSMNQQRGLKVLAVLYDGGKAAQEQPRLLGTTENKLGIANWLKEQGHELVTSDKEGPNSAFQKHLSTADILITTPFHPGYLTADLISKSPNLKLCVTAGVGSDHIDLNAAAARNITVAEVSGSNVVSVAEHVIMNILLLVRNFVPAHEMVERGDWQVSDIARNAFDLEGKVVGTIGAGRIGYRVLERLKPFNCKELLYYDYNALPAEAEKAVGVRRVTDLREFVAQCDLVTVNAPLHEGTKGLINKELLKHFKKVCKLVILVSGAEMKYFSTQGAWIINTARGAIADREAIAEALKNGHINGYAGDVWDIQPAPKDHPWRTMKNPLGGGNGMVPHYSGTTLDAQRRYAEGTKKILQSFFEGKAQDKGNLIVEGGKYITGNYGSRK
ncbi:formate dehydrogenase (NAD+) [Ceratobasidium sp. 395]|nr:formate dehydrogenase (NAD+) [Ceratobasidium sp. 395]